jgi:AcrR family transcriptional regulator
VVKQKAADSNPLKRVRRAPADMRAQALAAARQLIIEGSEQVLTMRAVADAAGVTYPNLSHHFGSAAGLHAAIAEDLVRELLAGLRLMDQQVEPQHEDYRRIVDRVFDMFEHGLGSVLGWLVRSGETARLRPVNALLAEFMRERARGRSNADGKRIARIALIVSFAAYAESSVGPLLGDVLGVTPVARRRFFAEALAAMQRADLE